MHPFELGDDRVEIAAGDLQRRVGAAILERQSPLQVDDVGRQALLDEAVTTGVLQVGPRRSESVEQVGVERRLDGAVLHVAEVGEPDPERREHPGVRVQVDAADPEAVGDETRVLTPGSAEADQRVVPDVVAPLHGDLLDRVGHRLDGDGEEPLRDLLGSPARRGGVGDLGRQVAEAFPDDVCVERLVAAGAEHRREELGSQTSEQDVAVGHRQRPTVAVRGGTGVGPRRVGADPESGAVEGEHRPTAGRHGVDVDHGGTHPHTGDLRLVGALQLAGEVRDVGRRSAHVESHEPVETGGAGRADHADDPSGGAREQGVLALERTRVGEPAVRLHEHQTWPVAVRAQVTIDPVDVLAQDR